MRCRFLALSILFAPLALVAQATVNVPSADPVNGDLDRLIGLGMLDTVLVGQRPLSRLRIARVIAQASRNSTRAGSNAVARRLLERLRRDFAAELSMLADSVSRSAPNTPMDELHLELTQLSSPPRPIPSDPAGGIDAEINPLLDYRAGRRFVDGTNFAAESRHSAHLSRYLVLAAAPRLLVATTGGKTTVDAKFHTLSATALIRNLSVEIGRDEVVWGQGMNGGLITSTSGRPLDMVRLSSDRPFYVPILTPIFGPAQGSFVFADLGPNQNFPHAKIAAFKLSGRPTARFEIGVAVLSEQGGQGAPAASWVDRVSDVLPLVEAIFPRNRPQFSNKFAGLDFRYRVPRAHGLQLYSEHIFDDVDPRRWHSTLWEDGGHVVGASMAQLGFDGSISAALEYHHTGLRYYEHLPFTSGLTFNRVLLGDPLGPKGNGGYTRISWDGGGRQALVVDASLERRSGDVYDTQSVGPESSHFHFVKVRSFPAEWRYRAVASWTYRASADRRVKLQAGYERARNFNFVQDATRNGFLASAIVEIYRGR
jgi:hypothetical protein